MKFLKRNSSVILLCLLEALIGLLLVIDPIGFTSGIIVAFGIGLMVAGLICIVGYFHSDPMEAALRGTLVKGLAMLLAGAFCVLKPTWFIATFPLLTILYGVIILFAGLSKVQWAIDALRLKTGRWFLPAISAVVSIICAFVVLANPFASTLVLWMFTGISLIVEAALDVVVLLFGRRMAEQHSRE